MQHDSAQEAAEAIAALMHERLGTRGEDLSAKLRRARRALPRDIRKAADFIAETDQRTRHPKLRYQLDMEQITTAYTLCETHLQGVKRSTARLRRLTEIAAGIALGFIVLFAAVITVLVWRGIL